MRMASSLGTRTSPVAWLMASLVAAPLGVEDVVRRIQGASPLPTPVIGNWTALNENGVPSLVVNGEQWDGRADAAALTKWSRDLFGAVSQPFVSNGVGESSFPLAVSTAVPSFGDGTLRVGFKMIGGASDQNAGIVFGLVPSGDYFYARYNTKDGDVAVWRYVNGKREVLQHGAKHVQLPLGSWQELVVTIRGREVRVHVTGHDSVNVVHQLPSAPRGRIGFWTKRDAITEFRNFRVEPARN